jgi:AcrR family transcriptional regulator/acyl-CoA thioesterase FadM
MSRPQAPARVTRPGASDNRRAELLDAARRVIQRRGFAKATVGAITGEAGASLGLLNYHFASRDDVVAEAFAAAARADLDELQAISRRHGDPPARLAAYLDLEAWADREVWRMWIDAWGEAVHTEKLRRTLEQFERGWRAVLAGVLADGARRDCWRCPDPEDAAGRLVAALDGLGLHTTLHPDDVAPEAAARWARRLVELELGATLPGAPAPEPARAAPTPHEARIPIRGRDLDATGRVHPAVLLTYVGEVREAWLDARLGGLHPVPRLEVAHVTADLRQVPARRDAEVVVRCVLDGLGATAVRTRETIETVGGALVVSAGATVVATGEDGAPRPLTQTEREALLR